MTPHTHGTATISASLTSNTTGGSFDLGPVVFIVEVVPEANTAPTVAVTGVSGGASYDKGSVPAAMCEVTDAEDGDVASFPATLSGTLDSDGLGAQTASCSYTDNGTPGLTALASETYSIVDSSGACDRLHAEPDGSGRNQRLVHAVTVNFTAHRRVVAELPPVRPRPTISDDQHATPYS